MAGSELLERFSNREVRGKAASVETPVKCSADRVVFNEAQAESVEVDYSIDSRNGGRCY